MGLGQQIRREYLQKSRSMDRPPKVDVAESIRETRRVYCEYNDQEFAEWYARRYGVRVNAIY